MRFSLLLGLAFLACASTELEVPKSHPASSDAPTRAVATSSVLSPGFDPFSDTTEAEPGGHGAAYACPKHPEVTSDKPGKCPKCGMALEPKKKVSEP